jgi:hypothetical protein
MRAIFLAAGVAGILGAMAVASMDAQAAVRHRHHVPRVVPPAGSYSGGYGGPGGYMGSPGFPNFNTPGRPPGYSGPGGYYYDNGDHYFGRGRLSGGGRRSSESAGQ